MQSECTGQEVIAGPGQGFPWSPFPSYDTCLAMTVSQQVDSCQNMKKAAQSFLCHRRLILGACGNLPTSQINWLHLSPFKRVPCKYQLLLVSYLHSHQQGHIFIWEKSQCQRLAVSRLELAAWVWILAMPLISCVTSGKFIVFSVSVYSFEKYRK